MAVYHDGYLFDPARFGARLAPYLQNPRHDAYTYRRLRTEGLRVLSESPQVQDLANQYGGWTLPAMTTQIPAEGSDDPEDAAFWVVLLLYDAVCPSTPPLGLGHNWRFPDGPTPPGIEPSEWRLLVYGRSFSALPVPADVDAGVLQAVRPASTASSAGWLDLSDIGPLIETVNAARSELAADAGPQSRAGLESAARMLEAAASRGCGLCVVTSG